MSRGILPLGCNISPKPGQRSQSERNLAGLKVLDQVSQNRRLRGKMKEHHLLVKKITVDDQLLSRHSARLP